MQIVNVTRNQVLSDQCRLASSFLQRLVGLLGRNSLPRGQGLLLDNCHGIHTIGMRFAIDILFLDRGLRVMRSASRVAPFHLGPVVSNASYVLELPSGMIEETGTEVGDQIQFRTGSEANGPADPLPRQGDPASVASNGRC